ncbi:MAG: PSD1 and planctomycete cytochrome C domain-containing protein [Pirellulaceae bacterium]
MHRHRQAAAEKAEGFSAGCSVAETNDQVKTALAFPSLTRGKGQGAGRKFDMRFVTTICGLALAGLTGICQAEDKAAQQIAFFEQRIEPILKRHCFACHSRKADEVAANFRLDSRAAMLRGGDSGPAIELDQPETSLLLDALLHRNGLEMPPEKPPLPANVVADFKTWLSWGAPTPTIDGGPLPEATYAAARSHWAFQAVNKSVAVPKRQPRFRQRNPIDNFIQAQLAERGWKPAAAADRTTWIRRVTFDLIGLPPTPAQTQRFLDDSSPQADERLVERLLASPRYGERWAQHWLDVVRFAETEGYEYDRHLPDAWRYRDYVMNSLNRDKPFNQFVVEQIAGDEISPDDPDCQSAVIFHRLGPVRRNAGNPEIALSRNEVLTERTNILGDVFIGLTVGCARCHNHKLEPIAQKDYYRLQAYLAATQEHDIVLVDEGEQRRWQQKTDTIMAEIKQLKAKTDDDARRAQTLQEIGELEGQLPDPLPTIPSIRNVFAERTEIHVLRRGAWEHKGVLVRPRPPSVLVPSNLDELTTEDKNPRTALADWLVSPAHPLTARVIVNRIWQHHFGTGLVETANDFGTHGSSPSHAALLDWLTTEFTRDWQWKPLHRLIVLSETYRQEHNNMGAEEAREQDPQVRLLWQFPRRRLSAEEIRDTMLSVSGRLNSELGGASIMIPVDPALIERLYKPTQWKVTAYPGQINRRSIYLIAKRNLRLPFMEAFDAPPLLSSCPQRETSIHAPQALELLNGDVANELANAFADRLKLEAEGDPLRIARLAFRLALNRDPTVTEERLAMEYLLQQASLSEFALAMFNLNDFVYVQ